MPPKKSDTAPKKAKAKKTTASSASGDVSLGQKVTDLEGRLGALEGELGTVRVDTTSILQTLRAAYPTQPPAAPQVPVVVLDDAGNPLPTGLSPAGILPPGKVSTRAARRASTRLTPYVPPGLPAVTPAVTPAGTAPPALTPRGSVNPAVNPATQPTAQPAIQQLLAQPAAGQQQAYASQFQYDPQAYQAQLQAYNSSQLFNPQLAPPVPPTQRDAALMSHLTSAAPSSQSLPMSLAQAGGFVLADQVSALLQSAQQISSIKGRPSYPHEYVFRGPTRAKTGLNSLELAEFLYGLFRMLNDPKKQNPDCPHIARHLYNAVCDAKDYKWRQVREWSEDVLTSISQNEFSWGDPEIEARRRGISQFRLGRLHPDQADSKPATKPTASAPPSSAPTSVSMSAHSAYPAPPASGAYKRGRSRPATNRTDQPCKAFNQVTGCAKPDGHSEAGVLMGHHCSWCRPNINKVHFHSDHMCQIKPAQHPFQA